MSKKDGEEKGKNRTGHLTQISGLAEFFEKRYGSLMPEQVVELESPIVENDEQTAPKETPDRGYLVVCWNDPVNLMDYVTHVFQVVFGWPKTKAETHMLQVHEKGKSVLVREVFEKAEHFVHQLQGYGLHATMEHDE